MHEALRSALRRHGWRERWDPPLLDGLLLDGRLHDEPPTEAPPPMKRRDACRPKAAGQRGPFLGQGAFPFAVLAMDRIGVVLTAAGATLLAALTRFQPPGGHPPLVGMLRAGAIAALGWLLLSGWLGLDLPIDLDF